MKKSKQSIKRKIKNTCEYVRDHHRSFSALVEMIGVTVIAGCMGMMAMGHYNPVHLYTHFGAWLIAVGSLLYAKVDTKSR